MKCDSVEKRRSYRLFNITAYRFFSVIVLLKYFKTKPKTIAKLKEALQVIWSSLPQGPIDKAVKNFSKRLKACVGAGGRHFEHSQWQQNSGIWWLVKLTVLFKRCYWISVIAWTFFNAEKSVGGDVKKSITSSFFNRITFHLAVRCTTFQTINV